MKKHRGLVLLFLVAPLFLSASTSWREKFKNIDHAKLEKSLGFNPRLELIEDNNPDVIHKNGPILYFHGWLGGKDAITLRNRCKDSNKLPGDIIVFNFPDASRWIGQTVPYWMPFSQSNFAQEMDIKTALCTLQALHEVGIHPPVDYAHSRGGAVAKKTIAILNNPSDEWKRKLEDIEMSYEDREEILTHLKVVYLETPLKDVNLAIKTHCENALAPLVYVCPSLTSFASEKLPAFMKNKILPAITSFDVKDTRKPMDYLKDWKGIEATIVLHFQHGDKKVPNDDDAECAKILLDAKPHNTHVIIGNDGGHEDGIITISKVIHTLNESCGGSFLNTQEALSAGKQLLSKSATLNASNVELYVHESHEKFAQDNQKRRCSIASAGCLSTGFITAAMAMCHK